MFQLIRKRPYGRDDDEEEEDYNDEEEDSYEEKSENSFDEIESDEEYQTFETHTPHAKEWKQYRNERIKVEYEC